MARYQSGSLQIQTTDLNSGTAINIGGVTQMDVSTGAETISDDSGSIYDEARSLLSEIMGASITTKAVDAVLTYIGIAGYCILSDGSHPGLRLYARVLGDCKSPPASTDNIRYTFATGLVVLGQLNATRGADATITLMIHPITDGTNAPMAGVYSSITMPVTSALSKNQFTLGVCKVGAITLTDLQSVTLDFGVQISAKTPAMGSVWPDSVAVRKVRPVVTLSGFDPRVLDDSTGIPLLGKQATHANTVIQLKKRSGYASFVANGTAQHIYTTVNGMATVTQAFSGSGNGEATNAIRVEGVHDGTNVPVICDLAHTYSATP